MDNHAERDDYHYTRNNNRQYYRYNQRPPYWSCNYGPRRPGDLSQGNNASGFNRSSRFNDPSHIYTYAFCNNLYTATRLPIMQAKINGIEGSCLHDSGNNVHAISQNKIAESHYLPYSAELRLFDGSVKDFPVTRIHTETPFITGVLEALVVEDPIDLIIGYHGKVSDRPLKEWLNDSNNDNDRKEQPRYANAVTKDSRADTASVSVQIKMNQKQN
ncbi:reverse transcriptase [Plakobranchus ocellatus]|uniref:Reverse transcriptase n=1 Tax=Plakobranchus ocellatus TaxID=259542 RepID=A0AAV4D7T4_9GAST|nr:reverse transcriptase [Plakobranchus ocellatus]